MLFQQFFLFYSLLSFSVLEILKKYLLLIREIKAIIFFFQNIFKVSVQSHPISRCIKVFKTTGHIAIFPRIYYFINIKFLRKIKNNVRIQLWKKKSLSCFLKCLNCCNPCRLSIIYETYIINKREVGRHFIKCMIIRSW